MHEEARRKLMPPSIALLILCGLNIAQMGFILFGMALEPASERLNPENPDDAGTFMVLVVWGISSLVATGLIAWGAFAMMRLKSYAWSLCAAMLALLPNVFFVCSPLSIGAGIWALILLFNKDVRGAFPGRHQISNTFD